MRDRANHDGGWIVTYLLIALLIYGAAMNAQAIANYIDAVF